MARPKRKRMVCWEPDYIHFQPDGISPSEQIILSVDEYEVIRLVDFEKKTHEETARQMQISRTTVTEIYESARFKLADCISKKDGSHDLRHVCHLSFIHSFQSVYKFRFPA